VGCSAALVNMTLMQRFIGVTVLKLASIAVMAAGVTLVSDYFARGGPRPCHTHVATGPMQVASGAFLYCGSMILLLWLLMMRPPGPEAEI
jgi:hypothetical protein